MPNSNCKNYRRNRLMTNRLTYWTALALMQGIPQTRKMDLFCKSFNALKEKESDPIVCLFEDDILQAEIDMTQEEKNIFNQEKSHMINTAFLTESLLNQGYNIVPVDSKEYPQLLKTNMQKKAPLVLFSKGDLELYNQQSVAIVGSRNADSISLCFTENIAKKAVSKGKVVISGGAKGVDSKALTSALDNYGKTIIVIPQGITTFGKGMREMYQHIRDGRVLVVSQFHPNNPWSVPNAMIRNGIIYALAQETFVAQSGSHGGTWSGATEALRNHRKVYVRWPEKDEDNSNKLLAQKGAIPVDINGNFLDLSQDDLLTPQEKEQKIMETLIKEFLKNGKKPTMDIVQIVKVKNVGCSWSDSKITKWLKEQNFISCEKISNRLYFNLKQNISQQRSFEF